MSERQDKTPPGSGARERAPQALAEPLSQTFNEAAERVKGRCQSCLLQEIYQMPDGPRYWCRGFGIEMSAEEREAVRGCERWIAGRRGRLLQLEANPLLEDQLSDEDRMFWHLGELLAQRGLDLKTVLVLVQPGLRSVSSLGWVDRLDERFEGSEEPWGSEEIKEKLRALGYGSLCRVIESLEERS